MTEDFVTRLGASLREAAERQEQRGGRARAAAAAQATLPRVRHRAALTALAAAAAIAFVVLAAVSLRPQPATPDRPEVIARLTPGGGFVQIVPAAGSAWLVDRNSEQLVRMDPARRRVTARIALPGIRAIAPSHGALWITQGHGGALDLLRFDPRSARVTERIRMPRDVGSGFSNGFPLAAGDALWVVGPTTIAQVDPGTRRISTPITIARDGYFVRDAIMYRGDLWALLTDGTLRRLDGVSGARKAVLRVPVDGAIGAGAGGLYLGDGTRLVRIDPATGHAVWSVAIPQAGPGAVAKGRLWIEEPGRAGDRVVAVDPRTGRLGASVQVGEFGAQAMTRIGPELWMATNGGHVVVLRP